MPQIARPRPGTRPRPRAATPLPPLGSGGQFEGHFGTLRGALGAPLGDLGTLWGHFGVTLGRPGSRLGDLGTLQGHFGNLIVLEYRLSSESTKSMGVLLRNKTQILEH